jgi:hypothetical protein
MDQREKAERLRKDDQIPGAIATLDEAVHHVYSKPRSYFPKSIEFTVEGVGESRWIKTETCWSRLAASLQRELSGRASGKRIIDRTFNKVPRRPNDEIQTRRYFLRPGLTCVVRGHRNLRARRVHSP